MRFKSFLFTVLFLQFVLVNAQQDTTKYEALKSSTKFWFGVRIDSAFAYASQMLTEAQKLADNQRIGESLIYQGLAHGYLDDFDNEIIYYQRAFAHGLESGDSLVLGKAYLNIGVNKFYRGSLDSAAISYEKARNIFEKIGEKKYLSFCLNNLGQIYTRTGNYNGASEAYEAAVLLKIEAKDSAAILNTYFNLSSLYVSNEAYEQARDYASKTLKLAQQLQDTLSIGSAWINIGVSLRKLGEMDGALQALKSAENYTPYFNKPSLLIDLYGTFTEIYISRDEIKSARVYLVKMQKVIRDDAFLQTQIKFYELSYQINKLEGNDAKALLALEKHQEVKEKYLSESVQKNISELEKKYQTEQQQRTIAELELDKKNAALALSSSNNQRNIFIFIAVLIIFIAVFLYYLYNTKRKTSEILTLKNSQISKALDEREVLLKEIHHRVKNNLQVVWSLLRLQGRSLKDQAAIEALTQGQNRVKSMALVHQRLYNTDDLRGVSVQDYFEKLTTELLMAFGVNHVEYKIETGHIKLDIDTMIPLGLVVNELMTNALKYAFSDKEDGLLELTMMEENDKLIVQLKDNGIGMDEESLKNSNSFGWKMIRSLSRELKAEIEIINNQGTTINLRLSRYKLVV